MFNLSKSKIFLLSLLSFIIGIAVSSFLSADILKFRLVYFSLIIVFGILVFSFWSSRNLRIIALCGLFLFLGIWRFGVSVHLAGFSDIDHYNGQTVLVTGTIIDKPQASVKNQKLTVQAEEINIKKREINGLTVNGKVSVYTGLYPVFGYGDRLEMLCKLKQPEPYNDFAYDKYLARYDIYSICSFPKIKLLSKDNGNLFYSEIYSLNQGLVDIINYSMPAKEAGLASGIILGERSGITDDLNIAFSNLGLSHIVAISGMNITILAGAFMALFLAVSVNRKKAFYLTSTLLIVFIILVGAPASAVRAGIMGILVLRATSLGRAAKLQNILIIAAFLMLIFNPKILRDDVGFQLSFLAVAAICYALPVIEKLNEWIEDKDWPKYLSLTVKAVVSILIMTTSIQLLTMPILAYDFSKISIMAPVANLFILWTQPPIMILTIIVLILSFLFPFWSPFFFLPTYALVYYIIKIVEYLNKFPYTYIEADIKYKGFLWLWIIVYYFVIILIYSKIHKKFILPLQRKEYNPPLAKGRAGWGKSP
jgi:competence protein ComEC